MNVEIFLKVIDKIDEVKDQLQAQQNSIVELKADLNTQAILTKKMLSDIERIDKRVDELFGRNEKLIMLFSSKTTPSITVEAGVRIDSIEKAGDIVGNDKNTK